jgi:hypothetical protein
MSAQFLLREEAAEIDRSDERLTGEIEDLEKRIVEAREKREKLRLHRAEFIAAAHALDKLGFRVDRDPPPITVHIDPPPWRCPSCRETVAPMGMCQTCGVFGLRYEVPS